MAIISTFTTVDKTTHDSRTTSRDLWLSFEKAYAPHSTSREYIPKTQLLRIEMHGDKTPDVYLNRAQEYANALAAIGEPVKDKDLVMLAISGLYEEYNGFKTTITARQSPTAFSELHALLSDHDYMHRKTRALAPSITSSFVANYAVGSPSMPKARHAQLLEFAAQLSALGFQVSPIAPSGPQAFYGARPSNNNRSNNNNRGNHNNSRDNSNRGRDTGANSHVTLDLEAMGNSEAYYGDNALHVGNAQKSDVYSTFKSFLQMVKRQFTTKLNNVQTDWGGEFRNLALFFSSLGIIHRRCCPHASEQNGFVERCNRHVMETGLTLLAQACVPQRFWHYALDTDVYLINHMPSRTSRNKSPFEHTSKRSFDYSFLVSLAPPIMDIVVSISLLSVFILLDMLKRDKNGDITRYKARFVAKVFRQQPDVQNAFLHGNFKVQVYMKQHPGFIDPQRPNHVCLLHKPLYDIKQVTRAWFERLSKALFDLGFKGSKTDPSLFIYSRGHTLLYILVYVDDIIVIGNNKGTIDNIICQLGYDFALKDLGPLSYFLGIEIVPHVSDILLFQKKYILKLLQRVGLFNCNPVSSLMVASRSLGLDDSTAFSNPVKYRQVVGSLQYVTLSWLDIDFAVNKVISILLLKLSQMLNGLGIQMLDAKYKAFADTVAELTWLQALIHDLGIRSSSTPITWCDKLGATYLSANLIFHTRTKHVEIDYYFVRKKVAQGDLRVQHISTHDQIADIFTKTLPTLRFLFLRSKLQVVASS
nr:integrase, catalytic core [Tanacetum cinerariifolium]